MLKKWRFWNHTKFLTSEFIDTNTSFLELFEHSYARQNHHFNHSRVKVPFLVKQHIHTVTEQHGHPVHHTSEHVHHKPVHHHGKSHSYEEISKNYASHAASDLTPIYVSHTPVQQSDSLSSYKSSRGFQPILSTKDSYPAYSHDFHSRLHTSVPSNVGFGSQEGKSTNYEVSESPEIGPFSREGKNLGEGKMTEAFLSRKEAYPYPLHQNEDKAEYLFGFDPIASSYDFTEMWKKFQFQSSNH